MSRRIERVGEDQAARPDPLTDPTARPLITTPPEPLPRGRAHSDYDDEVPSQRRLRWMTQVLVMPALVGGLWGLAYGLGYCAGSIRCGAADEAMKGFAAVALALIVLLAWSTLRGKIGARRRWVNVVLLSALLPLALAAGWRSATEPACGSNISEPATDGAGARPASP